MAKKKTAEQLKQEEAFRGVAKTVEERNIEDYIEDNYLPFSWSVCLDRALVYVEDGLKPIQRRILWTAYKNGITDKSPKMKSATFDGKVLEYSPHGGCFRGDTLIHTIPYGSVEIEKLCEMFDNGVKSIKAFCYDEKSKNIAVGEISNVWITKYVKELHKLIFSDGSKVFCTGNHPFMGSDGVFVKAEDINLGFQLKNYFAEDDNAHIYVGGYESVVDYDVDNDKISYETDPECSDEIYVIENTVVILDEPIPVYDFTENTNHNAFIVGNSKIDKESDKYNLICVHNSYGSMINIAESEVPGQPRAVRVPLLKIKGNAGGINQQTQPAAASRYTETGLWPAAMELIKELDENTVDLVPNYNNSDVEPVKLPVRFPVCFVNGVPNAMAVGFACNLPSHNPDEVMDACIALAKNPEMTIDDLNKIIKGPDFNCGCDIIANTVKDGKTVNGIKSYMETGSGTFIMKAKYELEEENGAYTISFKHLPYKVAPIDVIEDLKKCYNKGEFRELSYWNDLSDIKHPVNLVIQTKKNINISKVISDLYKKTCLQTTFAANNTVVYNNTPTKMDVKSILQAFIDFRKQCTERKLSFRLDKKKAKLHLNKAIAAVLLDIDKCISIIRNSEDESSAREELMNSFSIDEEQAKYILSIQLRRLTKSDINEINANIKSLSEEIDEIEEILGDNKKFISFIISELKDTKKVISSPRKCSISLNGKKSSDDVEDKDVYLVFSEDGTKVKRTFEKSDDAFKVDDSGRIIVVTKDKAFFSSVYELNDNRMSALTKFKVGSKPLGVSSAEGYLIFVGINGNIKALDLSAYKQPKKESVDKIMGQEVIYVKNVKSLDGEIIINDLKHVKLSEVPVQGIGANGRRFFNKPIEKIELV